MRASISTLISAGALAVSSLFSSYSLASTPTYMPSAMGDPQTLAEFFVEDVQFNPDIPTPESFLGYQPGEWHIGHDQLVNYMRLLAQKSDRINFEVIGYSHEQRPLVLLTVAKPERLNNIEKIRTDHIKAINGGARAKDAPAVVWMGYSVHGNEASGSNAVPLFAYYLAAAQGEKIDKLLDELVILVDPSLNPDGLNRFASWVNSHKGKVLNLDTQDAEHNEPWPRGRTNHYWFDLNRDWLLLRHPESRARVTKFHQWMPNVLTDFHEMGPNATYFFQPGITSRKNPWTPNENVTLTQAIADHHIETFDNQGVLYYSHESFDDFYYGKGSTYPDVHGSVGILFEQASARGFAQDTINGPLHFSQAIKNQLSTSLSTLDGALANKTKLLAYQKKFYAEIEDLADKDDLSGYVISEKHDKTRFNELLDLLNSHNIKAYRLTKTLKANNKQFEPEHSYFVPLNQKQYRLIKSVFSQRKSFKDNTFYDVSSWNLAYAFNIDFEPVNSSWGLKYSSEPWQAGDTNNIEVLAKHYAYGFKWDDSKAPKLLAKLLKKDIQVRVATKEFSAKTANSAKTKFPLGTILINSGIQTNANWLQELNGAQREVGLQITPILSGATSVGSDLGSRNNYPVYLPKVLLVGGAGSSSYEVGEIWHFLNVQMDLGPSIVDQRHLDNIDLTRYTHVILASGSYSNVSQAGIKKLDRWVKNGGIVWGQKNAAKWLIKKKLINAEYVSRKDMAKRFEKDNLSYGDRDAHEAKQLIAGAIFSADLDLTHPLTYGYKRKTLPVFKNSTLLLKKDDAPFVTVARYSKFPQLAGYADKTNVDKIAESSYMLAKSHGSGLVIAIADNVNFRGYWQGTSRLMANSLYFAPMVYTDSE